MPKRKLIKAGDAVKEEKTAADESVPMFDALTAAEQAADDEPEYRKVRIPSHRYTPLRKSWPLIVTPLVEQLKLQVRFNPRSLRRQDPPRDHLSRAVGRVAGADGKTRFAIENATRTRIVVANTHIHILGSAANIKVARDAICDLIIGAPPAKVDNRMRTVAKRLNARL
ncbi:RNA binding-protein [Aureococcus anophagefferens]|nr:RNA binding-protein [Aureococcus anophagefferens]